MAQSFAKLSKEEELDLDIAVKTAKNLISEGGGLDTIQKGLEQSQDPAQVVGQFLAQLIAQMHEQFPEDLNMSPKIYLAQNGVLEQLLDFLEKKLGLPKEFSDQVFHDVVEIFKAGAQGAQQPSAPQPAPAGLDSMGGQQPPAPAPGPPQPGMV